MKQRPLQSIKVTFPKPIGGYWDGGRKSGGTFEPAIHKGGYTKENGSKVKVDQHIEWGCWELNFYFRLPMTTKDPTSQAIRYIHKICRVAGIKTEAIPL